MKHLKISMIAFAAIVLGIAASAFTSHETTKTVNGKLLTNWYQFMGDPSILSQVQDNTKYQYQGGSPCSGSNEVCAVKTTGSTTTGSHPDAFSADLKSRLQEVFNQTNSYADISQEP